MTPDISYQSLAICLLLLLIPIILSSRIKLRIAATTVISAIRMIVQLFLVGIFLKYIFDLNNPILNVGWFVLMITFATLSVIRSTGLEVKSFLLPSFGAFASANFFVLIYFNYFVVSLSNIFEAKYLIAIGGMLLGNSLRGNIVGIGDFYNDLRKNEKTYTYYLSLGASRLEAAVPFLRKSLNAALKPTISSMATMGIVSLPGMMTGQILGGSSPLVAIKYQIAIMISIYASTTLSIFLAIIFTLRTSFDEFGILNKDIYKPFSYSNLIHLKIFRYGRK
ncbi:MAG: ABC transporter permease [Bacillota bacterium]